MSGTQQPQTEEANKIVVEQESSFLRPIQLELSQPSQPTNEVKIGVLQVTDYSTLGKEPTSQQNATVQRQNSVFGDSAPKVQPELNDYKPRGSYMSIEDPEESKKENKTDEKSAGEKANNNQLPQEYLMYDTNLIDQQNELIRAEIEKDSPLISDLLPLEMLEFEFTGNDGFMKKIPNLKKNYPEYRKVRRDGSCFYRSFLFRLFEHMIKTKDKALIERMINFVKDSQEYLFLAGYEVFVIDDFKTALLDKLELVEKGYMSEWSLIDTFRNKEKSDYLVMFMRFLTAGYLKTNDFLYEHFLEHGMTIDYFCQTEVEPIDKECDQIQMSAIVNFIQVPIKIIYLDGNAKKEDCDVIYLPEDANPKDVFITLLYRPGHYDILY